MKILDPRLLSPPHTGAFFIRSGTFRRDTSTYMNGRIVTDRNATHQKRIRVGRGLVPLYY